MIIKLTKFVWVAGLVGAGSMPALYSQRRSPCKMNNRGFVSLMVGILFAFLAVTMLITLLPGFVDMVDYGKRSDVLNCQGFTDYNLADGNQSYNSTIGTKSSIGCLALTLYIPYLVLGVLIAIVGKIFYDRTFAQASPYG